MNIGINALYLIPGQVGGTETYLRGLLRALAEIDSVNRYFLFTNRETGSDLLPKAPNFHLEPQPIRAVIRPARIVWEQTALPLAALRQKLDVLFNPGFTAPIAAPCPQVTVFHDLQHKRHPEYFRWFDLPFWNFFLFGSALISRLLLADSEATARDLFRFYRVSESKVRVVPLGVDPAFFDIAARRRPDPSHPFLLSASTLHPHKNLDGLLRAFARFHRRKPEYRLIVTGLHGFFTGPLHELRESLGLAEAVDFPGWIPRADLHDLFARASAFLYPSFFEGFGLPVVEALAAGVPTGCSHIEPLSSIAGGAALEFDPHNPDDIATAIVRLVEDDVLRTRLAQAGPLRAAEFSWAKTAQATLGALADAAA